MVCAFNKAAKILTGIGCCLIITGVLCLVIGIVSAATGFDIETQGGSTSFTISMTGSDMGHIVYIAQDAPCTDSFDFSFGDSFTEATNPEVTYSYGGITETLSISCGTIYPPGAEPETFEGSHDPPIRRVGSMSAMGEYENPTCTDTSHCENSDTTNEYSTCSGACNGEYQISCSTNCWVMDASEEFAEAAGGFMAMIGLVMVMAILLGVGNCLLCIACCCCCQGPDLKPGGGPVQGMVVGQPVGSA